MMDACGKWIMGAVDLGEPRSVGGFVMFPIRPNMLTDVEMVPVHDAVVRKTARIEENPAGATVSRLKLTNVATSMVLVRDGDLFVSGLQDRIADRPARVLGGQSVALPVLCVERGRWHVGARADFRVAPFDADLGLRSVRMSGVHRSVDQGVTWDLVVGRRSRRQHGNESGSLVDSQERDVASVEAVAAATPPPPGATGIVLCRAGSQGPRVALIEWFADPLACALAWAGILRGALLACVDAPAPPPVSRTEVRQFMEKLLAKPTWREDDAALGVLRGYRRNGASARMLCEGEKPLYLAAVGT